MNITNKEVAVTPEQAGTWLTEHWKRIEGESFTQRPLSMTRVLRYAQLMRDKQWCLTPQGIAWDENGNLIDGQHRLEACRRSGVTVAFMCSWGWPPKTLTCLDQGSTRSVGQLLGLEGMMRGKELASCCATIARIGYRGHSATITFPTAKTMLAELDLQRNIEAVVAKSPTKNKDMAGVVAGTLAYYHTARPGKALAFAESLFNFETTKDSPVNLYLRWMKSGRWTNVSEGGIKKPNTRHLAGLISCIRAWDGNEILTRVVPTYEAVQWLADLNPKLRDWIKEHITTSWKAPKVTPGKK